MTGPKASYAPSETQLACAMAYESTPLDSRNLALASTDMPDHVESKQMDDAQRLARSWLKLCVCVCCVCCVEQPEA